MLENGSFEGTWRNWQGIRELTVPEGWTPWWAQGTPEQTAEGYLLRPEYKPETRRVCDGKRGCKWFTTFGTHDAGLLQRVRVPRGVALWLSAQVQYWSEHTDGSGGGLACRVGIDPGGGDDPFAEGVVWGAWLGQDSRPAWDGRTWREVSVEVQATGEWVTLFLRSACRYRARHNGSYWDDVRLVAAEEEGGVPDLIDVLDRLGRALGSVDDHLVELNRRLAGIFRAEHAEEEQ